MKLFIKCLPIFALLLIPLNAQQPIVAAQGTAANLNATVVPGTGVFEVGPTGSANTSTNPFFFRPTDGTNPMGVMTNFGTTPTAVYALNVNSSMFMGTTAMAVNPCEANTILTANISLTGSGTVITGASTKKTYICALDIVTATAQNIALVEGTSTNCGTGIAGMAGGTTAATGWNFSANGGLTKGSGIGPIFIASNAAADNVCLLLSGSGQTSGSIQYVQQ